MEMRTLLSDLRYGARLLARRPGFAVASVLALALGICANAAIFSIVYAVLLRPLPYARPNELITLRQVEPRREVARRPVSPATYLDWHDAARSVSATAAVRPWSFTHIVAGEPEVIPAGLVSEGFFEVIGVPAAVGRTFTHGDFQPGAPAAAVLSHSLWRTRFGADPSLVGRSVPFGSQSVMIVGVLPAEFRWIERDQLLWAPWVLTENARQLRTQTYVRTIGRLKPGNDVRDAQLEAAVIHQQLAKAWPHLYKETELVAVPIDEEMLAGIRPALLLLFSAVGMVLLIACANVANLVLARSAERRREFSVRTAVGASPRRLAAQLLTESLLLAILGCIAGLALAHWLLEAIVGLTPGEVPRLDEAAIDWRVALFGAALAIVAAAVVGFVPAWQLARADLTRTLRSEVDGGGPRSVRLRRWLVGAEVAVTVVLLTAAGLLGRSFLKLASVDPGFASHNVATLETHIWTAYPKPEEQALFFRETLERVRRLPGVAFAGAVSALPFLGEASIEIEAPVRLVGTPEDTAHPAWLSIVAPDYFAAMGIPLRRGRAFDDRDRAGSEPVAIVSEGLARRQLGTDPVGRTIVVAAKRVPVPVRVIGVVGDVRHVGLDSAGREEVFVPLAQSPFGSMNIVVRAERNPTDLLPSIKSAVRSVNASQTFGSVTTLETLVDATIAPRRFYVALALSLALVALTLATIGTYGVISVVTAQRTREIGLRIALGGSRRDILRLVVGNGILAPAAGALAGIAAALAMSRSLEAYLFGIAPTDPGTFALVGLLVILLAVAATYIPARRALRVDPVVALRQD
jgi:putative ABC transport system permease protein